MKLIHAAWGGQVPAGRKLVLLALAHAADGRGNLPRLGAVDLIEWLSSKLGGSGDVDAEREFWSLQADGFLCASPTLLVWRLSVDKLNRARHVN